MEVEEGLYHASGAEWPPTMYFKALDNGEFAFLYQDEGATAVIGLRRAK
jgi:hypothetical protein